MLKEYKKNEKCFKPFTNFDANQNTLASVDTEWFNQKLLLH